ncbi:MAG TPA: hypothetical protein VM779_11775 [Thermoanaerobaculia bacterium]|nr:hypothetical protein [Thermoanaerobaculia bacterium]
MSLLISFLALPAFAATEKRLDEPQPAVARAGEPTVTIDVKDAEVAVILKDLKKQCGIRNLMIDPNVEGKGTFYFRDVPCRLAFGVVLRSLGLDASYSSSVVTVGKRGNR